MKKYSSKRKCEHRTYKQALLIWICILMGVSCKKQIEVQAPPTSVNASNVYATDATAAAVLTSIYTNLSSKDRALNFGGLPSISLFAGLSADELTLFNPANQSTTSYQPYYTNSLTNLNSPSFDFWYQIYPIIFVTNSAIEGLSNSTTLTPLVKNQLIGEARFIRAFCFFYLVNLYGDVPLVLTSDWKANTNVSREAKAKVWQQIIDDLKSSQDLLSGGYVESDAITNKIGTERVRPNKFAASALLARAYLYSGDYLHAGEQATTLINNTSIYSLNNLANAFKPNNSEVIWNLQPVGTGTNANTGEGAMFVLTSAGPNTSNYPVYLSPYLMNAFENNDQRKVNWTGNVNVGSAIYSFANKYKMGAGNTTSTEYSIVLRLSEQYLIRAEAFAQQGNISGSQADLNIIRARAGLPNTLSNDKASLLSSILHERQVELFTEWGHRWLDLKRTGQVDAVMSVVTPQKGGLWNTNWQWFPIILTELQKDPNLLQNSGY
ncbi:MAG: RagB/SusD family nutrient uptake outer membrane protein [Bacteroidota bacterium]